VGQYVCRYRKGEQVRWLSHLDVKRTLERAMRRAELPLELTKGHNPRPKLSLGPPLPLGATGEGELLALHLSAPMDPGELKARLNAQLPAGLEVVDAWSLPGYRKKETFGEVDVAEYEVRVRAGWEEADLSARISELLARQELVVQRGGERPERVVDVRPHILSVRVTEAGEKEAALLMRLRTGSHGGARPQEVLSLLGVDEGRVVRCHRTGLYASAKEAPARPRPRWGAGRRRRTKGERGWEKRS